MSKKILFITGTRADFGKLKPLMKVVQDDPQFECFIFGTGMHMLSKYGDTIKEIKRSGFDNIFMYINQMEGESMEIILANTITGLTRYLQEYNIDLVVIHGDRIEALAGAIVGALRNTLVAHVEGGEISGTIDDLIRHAASKLSHIHFVANNDAKKRLKQLGETTTSIYKIGSPDIDIMLSDSLPTIEEVKQRYQISFDNYAIAMLHPVTTELDIQEENAIKFVEALLKSGRNYVVIYPNNDLGSDKIYNIYKKELEDHKNIKIFPSVRFEYFLSLLKYTDFIIGNSSAGIHEAPVYGVPSINVGTRQNNRFQYESIFNVDFDVDKILEKINIVTGLNRFVPCDHFGNGKSAENFLKAIKSEELWQISKQKVFSDIKFY